MHTMSIISSSVLTQKAQDKSYLNEDWGQIRLWFHLTHLLVKHGAYKFLFTGWLLLTVIVPWFRFITMALDHVFFPGFKKVKVEKPLFILGHGRSGTTFFHEYLHKTEEFAGFGFWHILVPSITGRILSMPLIVLLRFFHKSEFFSEKVGHRLSLSSIEEEEFLFFSKYLDTNYMSLLCPWSFIDPEAREWVEQIILHDRRQFTRKKAARYLKECFQRHIYYTGRPQIIAKMGRAVFRMESLLEEFPDARIVYMVRRPSDTLVSHYDLHEQILGSIGVKVTGADFSSYYASRYQYAVAQYRHFEHLKETGIILPERLYILPYSRLRSHLAEVSHEVLQFAEIIASEKMIEHIHKTSIQNQEYQRPHHRSSLERYGLSMPQIVKDLNFVVQQYQLSWGDET